MFLVIVVFVVVHRFFLNEDFLLVSMLLEVSLVKNLLFLTFLCSLLQDVKFQCLWPPSSRARLTFKYSSDES